MEQAKKFVQTYLPFAKQIEKETGLHHIAILTQSALESGWGKSVKGNNFFGIKWNGKGEKQLIRTREVLSRKDYKFPVIHAVTPKGNTFVYDVEDYFVKYNNPFDSFKGHYEFLNRNPRYKKALEFKGDYNKFFEEIAKAGYATDPNYAQTLKEVAKSVIRRI